MSALVSVCHPSCGQRPLGFRWLLMYSLSFNILAVSGVRAELLGCTGDCVCTEQGGSGDDLYGCRWACE